MFVFIGSTPSFYLLQKHLTLFTIIYLLPPPFSLITTKMLFVSMVPVLIKLMVLRGNQVLNKFAKVMAIPEGKMKNKAGNANAGG